MIYNTIGERVSVTYDAKGDELPATYDINGNNIFNSGGSDVYNNPYYEGMYYPFADMEMLDNDGVTSVRTEHTKRAEQSVLLQGTGTGSSHTVTFICDISLNDEPNIGFWIWIDRNTKGNYDAVTVNKESTMTITCGNTTKTFRGKSNDSSLKSGMNYYLFTKNEIGSETVLKITITVTGAGTFYLDSVEVGFRMKVPCVLINLDCSGRNFYPVGYPLFKKYGLTATFDYNINNSDVSIGASSGSWEDDEDAKKHFEMVNDGFDYGSYSGWVENEGTRPPSMDDETYHDTWLEHGKRMFALNNVFRIYAPSTVHCNAFKSGEVYQKAMIEAGFICVRTDARNSDGNPLNEFAYFDDEYREITPYYLGNCWNADDPQITNMKIVLSHCVRTGQNCMVMMHTIEPEGYDHSEDTLNVGYAAIDELLKTIKSYADEGKLRCLTTADFVKRVQPDVYKLWIIERNKSLSNI